MLNFTDLAYSVLCLTYNLDGKALSTEQIDELAQQLWSPYASLEAAPDFVVIQLQEAKYPGSQQNALREYEACRLFYGENVAEQLLKQRFTAHTEKKRNPFQDGYRTLHNACSRTITHSLCYTHLFIAHKKSIPNVRLSSRGQSVNYKGKGGLYATITVNGQPMSFASVHLESKDLTMANQQLADIKRLCNNDNLLIGGDFNTRVHPDVIGNDTTPTPRTTFPATSNGYSLISHAADQMTALQDVDLYYSSQDTYCKITNGNTYWNPKRGTRDFGALDYFITKKGGRIDCNLAEQHTAVWDDIDFSNHFPVIGKFKIVRKESQQLREYIDTRFSGKNLRTLFTELSADRDILFRYVMAAAQINLDIQHNGKNTPFLSFYFAFAMQKNREDFILPVIQLLLDRTDGQALLNYLATLGHEKDLDMINQCKEIIYNHYLTLEERSGETGAHMQSMFEKLLDKAVFVDDGVKALLLNPFRQWLDDHEIAHRGYQYTVTKNEGSTEKVTVTTGFFQSSSRSKDGSEVTYAGTSPA